MTVYRWPARDLRLAQWRDIVVDLMSLGDLFRDPVCLQGKRGHSFPCGAFWEQESFSTTTIGELSKKGPLYVHPDTMIRIIEPKPTP